MKAVVVTVSDRVSRGEAEDRSGPAAASRLASLGLEVEVRVVPDGEEPVAGALRAAVAAGAALVVAQATGLLQWFLFN